MFETRCKRISRKRTATRAEIAAGLHVRFEVADLCEKNCSEVRKKSSLEIVVSKIAGGDSLCLFMGTCGFVIACSFISVKSVHTMYFLVWSSTRVLHVQ